MPPKRWKNKQGKTLKEINEISERLYSSGNANTTRIKTKETSGANAKQMSKEDLNTMVERLHAVDTNAKRTELNEKHYMNMEKERPDNLGWQKIDKGEIDTVTSRLFIADYSNRNVGKQAAIKVKDKEMTKEDFDAMVDRLFISGYSNRNLVKNKQFYDTILNKKKAEEKIRGKEDFEESVARLTKVAREPAECNKALLGKQAYTAKGIYGTLALNGGNKMYYKNNNDEATAI